MHKSVIVLFATTALLLVALLFLCHAALAQQQSNSKKQAKSTSASLGSLFSDLVLFPSLPAHVTEKAPEKMDDPARNASIKTGIRYFRGGPNTYCPYKGFNKYDFLALVYSWPTAYCVVEINLGTFVSLGGIASPAQRVFLQEKIPRDLTTVFHLLV